MALNAGPPRSACARRSSNQTVRYDDDGGIASKQRDRGDGGGGDGDGDKRHDRRYGDRYLATLRSNRLAT